MQNTELVVTGTRAITALSFVALYRFSSMSCPYLIKGTATLIAQHFHERSDEAKCQISPGIPLRCGPHSFIVLDYAAEHGSSRSPP